MKPTTQYATASALCAQPAIAPQSDRQIPAALASLRNAAELLRVEFGCLSNHLESVTVQVPPSPTAKADAPVSSTVTVAVEIETLTRSIMEDIRAMQDLNSRIQL
jgi:hypothetical protein